jgi:hypothetical protein
MVKPRKFDRTYRFTMVCECCKRKLPQYRFHFDEDKKTRNENCYACQAAIDQRASEILHLRKMKIAYRSKFKRTLNDVCTTCGKRDFNEFESVRRLGDLSADLFACWSCKQKERAKYTSGVYFIRARHMNQIKIGFSEDVHNRLGDLQVGNADMLELVAVIPQEYRGLEKALHKRFSHLCTHGEWHEPAPDLIDYIKTHANVLRKFNKL